MWKRSMEEKEETMDLEAQESKAPECIRCTHFFGCKFNHTKKHGCIEFEERAKNGKNNKCL